MMTLLRVVRTGHFFNHEATQLRQKSGKLKQSKSDSPTSDRPPPSKRHDFYPRFLRFLVISVLVRLAVIRHPPLRVESVLASSRILGRVSKLTQFCFRARVLHLCIQNLTHLQPESRRFTISEVSRLDRPSEGG